MTANPPLGLYIHLPWCEKKCPYCDFNSHQADQIPEIDYIDALLNDLEQDLPLIWGRSIETMFIGGGTPSPIICGGSWEGVIQLEPRGEGGFGYDPYFYLPDLGCTSAELSAEDKNNLSHRGQALRQLRKSLTG